MAAAPNLVVGANQVGLPPPQRQLRPRLQGRPVADIAAARAGDRCAAAARRGMLSAASRWGISSSWARATRGRGRRFTETRDGGAGRWSWAPTASVWGGCWPAVEKHHDDKGIVWPVSVAPYEVHLVLRHGKETGAAAAADAVRRAAGARLERALRRPRGGPA